MDKKKLTERANNLKKDIPAIFFALNHPKTPLKAKLIAAATVAYALSPVDLIPDFIPVLGLIDDIILLPALIAAAVKLIPKDVLDECRSKAEDKNNAINRSNILYALPVISIWIIILLFVIHQMTTR